MKKLLLMLLLIPCLSQAMDVEIQKKNGIEHWDDVVMILYRQPSTQRMAYFLKQQNKYCASPYQTGNEDILRMNPPKLNNPEQVFEELKREFSK